MALRVRPSPQIFPGLLTRPKSAPVFILAASVHSFTAIRISRASMRRTIRCALWRYDRPASRAIRVIRWPRFRTVVVGVEREDVQDEFASPVVQIRTDGSQRSRMPLFPRLPVASGLPTLHQRSCREPFNRPRRRLLTNPDLSSHAINQFLGIVADPGLEHCLDVFDLVNAL